tara:strand:- start:1731 stop:2048 length:318 start_codon:yes stop_codon:yes gene_type:complete
MKNLILFLLFVVGNSIYAQDTLTYFVAKNGKKTAKENAVGFRKVIKTTEGTFKVKDFYMDEQLQMTGTYLTDSLKKKTGLFKAYLKSGALESQKLLKMEKKMENQ